MIVKPNNKKEVILDNVKLKEEINKNDSIAIMLEQSDGTYKESNESMFPTNMLFNGEKSGCIDKEGNKLNNSLTYSNGLITITTNKTTYCYVYFDRKEDGSLSLSETSGEVGKGSTKTITVTNNVSGGALSVTSGNNNIATASISGNTITITGVSEGSTTITVTSAETGTHFASSVTYNVTVNRQKVTITVVHSGSYTSSNSQHAGITYNDVARNEAGTFEAYVGDILYLHTYMTQSGSSTSTASITVNGQTVTSVSNYSGGSASSATAKYAYTVVSDATIDLSYTSSSWYGGGMSKGALSVTDTNQNPFEQVTISLINNTSTAMVIQTPTLMALMSNQVNSYTMYKGALYVLYVPSNSRVFKNGVEIEWVANLTNNIYMSNNTSVVYTEVDGVIHVNIIDDSSQIAKITVTGNGKKDDYDCAHVSINNSNFYSDNILIVPKGTVIGSSARYGDYYGGGNISLNNSIVAQYSGGGYGTMTNYTYNVIGNALINLESGSYYSDDYYGGNVYITEIPESYALVIIEPHNGDADDVADVTINGNKYSATMGNVKYIVVPIGTKIYCNAVYEGNVAGETGNIYLNNNKVASSTYTYTIKGNITIQLNTKNYDHTYYGGNVYITEK